jgi:hypothetical protein
LVSELQLFGALIYLVLNLWERPMLVELYCPKCDSRFTVAPGTPAASVFDRVSAEGPWSALGDGETFEDSVAAALADRGAGRCPRCGTAATVSEESLGRFTRDLLGTW